MCSANLRLSAVTFLPFLYEAVPAPLPSHQVLHVGHVEQTHPASFLKVVIQVFLATAAEDFREGVSVEKGNCHCKCRRLDKGTRWNKFRQSP